MIQYHLSNRQFKCNITKIFATNHASCIETNESFKVIVHMGIDTLALKEEG